MVGEGRADFLSLFLTPGKLPHQLFKGGGQPLLQMEGHSYIDIILAPAWTFDPPLVSWSISTSQR